MWVRKEEKNNKNPDILGKSQSARKRTGWLALSKLNTNLYENARILTYESRKVSVIIKIV